MLLLSEICFLPMITAYFFLFGLGSEKTVTSGALDVTPSHLQTFGAMPFTSSSHVNDFSNTVVEKPNAICGVSDCKSLMTSFFIMNFEMADNLSLIYIDFLVFQITPCVSGVGGEGGGWAGLEIAPAQGVFWEGMRINCTG